MLGREAVFPCEVDPHISRVALCVLTAERTNELLGDLAVLHRLMMSLPGRRHSHAACGALGRTGRGNCQEPAFRNMKSLSESRPIVGSGGGSVSWVAIMSSGRMRSGS